MVVKTNTLETMVTWMGNKSNMKFIKEIPNIRYRTADSILDRFSRLYDFGKRFTTWLSNENVWSRLEVAYFLKRAYFVVYFWGESLSWDRCRSFWSLDEILKLMIKLVDAFQVKVYSIESVPNKLGQELQKTGRNNSISQPEAIETLGSYWVTSKILWDFKKKLNRLGEQKKITFKSCENSRQ